MSTHKNLEVWKKSIDLVISIYNTTKTFPEDEKFGLSSQLKRAAISIPSNISEGASRNGIKEYLHFLYISLGSASEIETQLIIAEKLGYKIDSNLLDEINHLKAMLINYISYKKRGLKK
ncbi:MAG: four helix bundle protein [Bacteroidetes bacterium]|nr:four helix bundle protein [Bacteroidota bacterium]|tara:strand:- start:73 stop:429 length:357 start_codon:yes stop_codon:yes gene_type:complete